MAEPEEAPGARVAPNRPRVGPVFAAYVAAALGILAFQVAALGLVHQVYPDLPERDISLPVLLASGLATATALMVTLLAVVRPLDARRLRLLPGRESGAVLGLMIVGTLALSQGLDSAAAAVGLADRGSMGEIRRVLAGVSGGDLFAAVVVIGPVAGAAEEIFFRGFMQTALVAAWRPAVSVTVTAAAFALLHGEPIHATFALALGLWLGAVTEQTQSALPAVTAHVVNNTVSTLLTAQGVEAQGLGLNLAIVGVSAAVFVAVVVVLRWRV